jgi:hypothetical protein
VVYFCLMRNYKLKKRGISYYSNNNNNNNNNNNLGKYKHLKIKKYLNNLTRKHDIDELQKAVILGTEHMLRKSTIVKVQNVYRGK